MPKLGINNKGIFHRIKSMADAGCEIVRIGVRDKNVASGIGKLKSKINIPLVADIHFDYQLALISIKEGVDAIRLNPGNIYRIEQIEEIIDLAKKYKVPIRVGVNSGSCDNYKLLSSQPWAKSLKSKVKNNINSVDIMVSLTLDYVRFLEMLGFGKIIISIKSEDVFETIQANRKIAKLINYPLHLGVTATGVSDTAIIKSAIGIGALLTDGIGDIIRVSLTSSPINEIKIAQKVLSSLHIREFGPEIISCPMCSRSLIDVKKITKQLEHRVNNQLKAVKIAVMGCEVNGPGEAKGADIGIAGGRNSVLLFKKGKKLKKVSPDKAVDELVKLVKYINQCGE